VCSASALTIGDNTEDQSGNKVLVRSWILVVDCSGSDVPETYLDNEYLSSGKVYVLSVLVHCRWQGCKLAR